MLVNQATPRIERLYRQLRFTVQFLQAPRHDQPVAWTQTAVEQKILREFWDTTAKPHRIW